MAKVFSKKDKNQFQHRINDDIKYVTEVRLVGDNVENGIISLKEAKNLAEQMELDLVEINNKVQPPIVRICNYEKMLYELKKNAKKNKQQANQLKEVQLSVNIASHDIQVKAKQAKKFIEEGHKVKVVLTMRGRELTRRDENKKSLLEFITVMEDVAVAEAMPRDEGNKTIIILKKRK